VSYPGYRLSRTSTRRFLVLEPSLAWTLSPKGWGAGVSYDPDRASDRYHRTDGASRDDDRALWTGLRHRMIGERIDGRAFEALDLMIGEYVFDEELVRWKMS